MVKKCFHILLLLIATITCKAQNSKDSFLIKSITLVKATAYVIYATKGEFTFKIISAEPEQTFFPVKGCSKIQVGHYYDLKLKSVHDVNNDSLPTKNPEFPEPPNVVCDCFEETFIIHGISVKLEEGIVQDLFTSLKLKGLCYLE